MARGKHAALAENRNWSELQEKVKELEARLQFTKEALHNTQKENLRLRSIEQLVESEADVIAELQATRKELDDVYGKLLVRVERERRWASVMMAPENEQFLKVNRDLAADLVELGHWPNRLIKTRRQRRNTKTGKAVRKALNARAEREKQNV